MNKIVVSAGHNPDRKGASFGEFNEHDEAIIWLDLLGYYLGDQIFIVPTGGLRRKVEIINNADDVKLAIEIHFNSAKNSDGEHVGRGCETLYCPGSVKGKDYASQIQDMLANNYQPSRGIKEGWYRMDKSLGKKDYFLEHTKMPALIIEPDFVHRVKIIQDGREDTCKKLASLLKLI